MTAYSKKNRENIFENFEISRDDPETPLKL